MKNRILLFIMIVLATVFVDASQVSANLIVNGSFENPVVPEEELPPAYWG